MKRPGTLAFLQVAHNCGKSGGVALGGAEDSDMFNSINSDISIWLTGLAALVVIGVALPLSRFLMRRRMRKKEWSASQAPITIDFTGQAGLTRQVQQKATPGGQPAARREKTAPR